MAPPSKNTATDVYSHCTNRFEHHTVAVFTKKVLGLMKSGLDLGVASRGLNVDHLAFTWLTNAATGLGKMINIVCTVGAGNYCARYSSL